MAESLLTSFPPEIIYNIVPHLIESRSDTHILVYPRNDTGASGRPRFRGYACTESQLNLLLTVTRDYIDFEDDSNVAEKERFRYKGFASLVSLMRTCKALYKYAHDELYGKSTLQFLCLEDMENFLTVINPHSIPQVRHIKVSFSLWPLVPQHQIPSGHGGAPDVHVAMIYLRNILRNAPELPRMTVVTYALADAWADDIDDIEELIEEHRDVVELTEAAVRDVDGRDIDVTHSIILSDADGMAIE